MKKRAIILIGANICRETENILHSCSKKYVDCVCRAGGIPLLMPSLEDKDMLAQYIEIADGVLFTGGKDYPVEYFGGKPCPEINPMDPLRANSDIFLGEAVLRADMPVLGICAGAQLLSIASGGKLICHINNPEAHSGNRFHNVNIKEGHILKGLFGEGASLEVVSAHHQAISPEAPGRNMKISALAGDGTVEAIEPADGKRFMLGLQWHPERAEADGDKMKIFKAFVSAATEYAERRKR